MKYRLSVIVIARNEEKKIGDCLKSVRHLADEVILVDNDSSDNTAEIGYKHGARITKASGDYTLQYSELRNLGLKKAKGEWVLYIDADERVTPNLRREIVTLLSSSSGEVSGSGSIYNAYAIPRKNIVLGKELKHGGFGESDYVKRLFRRNKLKMWTGRLHEEPNFLHNGRLTIGKKGELGHLKNKLVHIKAGSLSEMVEKTNQWSEVEAKLMHEAGHPEMNIPRFLTAMFREFWFRIVKKKAFLDGSVGIIHALYQVFSRFISYAKLWELQLSSQKLQDTNH